MRINETHGPRFSAFSTDHRSNSAMITSGMNDPLRNLNPHLEPVHSAASRTRATPQARENLVSQTAFSIVKSLAAATPHSCESWDRSPQRLDPSPCKAQVGVSPPRVPFRFPKEVTNPDKPADYATLVALSGRPTEVKKNLAELKFPEVEVKFRMLSIHLPSILYGGLQRLLNKVAAIKSGPGNQNPETRNQQPVTLKTPLLRC